MATASVLMATSTDEANPAANIVSPDMGAVWTTTGLFPQTVVVEFGGVSKPKVARVWCSNVSRLSVGVVAVSSADVSVSGEAERTLDVVTQGQIQMEAFDLSSAPSSADALHITIHAAFGPFAAIHRVAFE